MFKPKCLLMVKQSKCLSLMLCDCNILESQLVCCLIRSWMGGLISILPVCSVTGPGHAKASVFFNQHACQMVVLCQN